MRGLRIQFKLVLMSAVMVGGGVLHCLEDRDFGSSDEASKTPAETLKVAERSTELGEAIPLQKKSKKEVEVIMKDPAMSQKWGLKLTDAQKAWKVSQGSRDIVIAIIDTGIDINHPDLKNNLWINKGEYGKDAKGRNKASNGVDDDGNGFIDDVHGWNFVGNDADLRDNHGHGTHISGIVGAEGGNGIGISGVAPKVSLMVLKYYDPKAKGINNLTNTIKAIDYAVKMKAHIINYSGGGLEKSQSERAAIARAQKQGILFVAAAGNERSNSDKHGYYPADYDLPNIISVTAIDKGKNILPTSNYGVQTVDIAAPGNDIFSTLPDGQYGRMTGTSQATAFVSGVAALIIANNRDLRPLDIVKYLTNTGDVDQRLVGKTRYKRRLNSYRALTILDQGLGLTGVIATNTVNMDPKQFSSETPASAATATPALASTESSLASSLREIQAHIKKENPHVASQEPNPKDETESPQL